MAESDEDYVQRRFRETPKKSDLWTRPDVWTRPAQFDGMDGGQGSYSVPISTAAEPIVNGTPTSSGAGGGTKRVIITDSGVANYYNIVATLVGPV